MSNFQKVFFVSIIALAVAVGNRFGGVGRADEAAGSNPAFSSAGNAPALLGSAATIAETASEQPAVSISQEKILAPHDTPKQSAFYRFGAEPAPAIQAHGALLADLEGGQPYLVLNASGRWPLASITKLMTAALARQSMDQDKVITLSDIDFVNGTQTAFFKTGLSYSVRDIMKIMLLLSKNEAAEALANAYGRNAFIEGLNALAAEWGLTSTHFDDPSGLSVANQSTNEDIAALVLRISRDYPDILNTTRLKTAVVREVASGKKTTVTSINQFAGRPDFVGGKTGYTDEAEGNLVSLFSYQRHTVVIVVLGTGDRFGETQQLYDWFKKNFRATN